MNDNKPMSGVTPADAQNTHQGHPTPASEGAERQDTENERKVNSKLKRTAAVPEGGAGYES